MANEGKRNAWADTRSILIADPDPQMRVLAGQLVAHDYTVRLAHTGRHACTLLAKSPAPALALVELRLPDMNGLDLLRRLRDQGPTTKTVIVTAYGSIASAVQALRLGAVDYLCKPIGADTLVAALRCGSGVQSEPKVEAQWDFPSLHRAKWEYINFVLTREGTIAGAARRMRVDRRSLRRMLQKTPPAR